MNGNDHIMRGRLRLLLASSSVAALLLGGGPRSAFAACTINDVGVNVAAVSNSAAIDCINVQNSTVTGSVTNTGAGTLTPVGITPPTATGITINNSKIGGSVSNAGTITAPLATGIVVNNNSSVAGRVTNSGSLSAGIFGINVFNNGTFGGGISNSGTVSAGGTGIIAAFVGTFAGGITNSGTVTAGIVGLAASGDLSFTGGIANAAAGTITGANAGISVTQVSTFLGGIANAGVIKSVHTGIFIDGGNTFGGGIANSGTISASNVGIQIGLKTGGGTLFGVTSFGGNVSNAGTITAKTGISIVGSTVNGAIVDSGTLNATSRGILIDNTSKIVSSPTAIRINGPTFTGGISNAGAISSALGQGISVFFTSTFLGGITNSGTVSASGGGVNGTGISAFGFSTFSGGISNSGTITSTIRTGIGVANFSNFSGGIRNSGTLSAGGNGSGIVVSLGSTFSGGIANSGMISGHTQGIFVFHLSTFSGGITNSGSVSATGVGGVVGTRAGISVTTVSAFSGGISNSGTISVANGGAVVNNRDGISVTTVSTFVGGISNSGTVSVVGVPGVGINVSGVSTFSGNISNAGAITANTGIKILSNVTFAAGGAIANSGNITGTGGTAIDASAATSPVTINQIAGAISGAIKLSANADVLNITGGTINGNIVGAGASDTINFGLGAGTLTYNSAFTGINQVNINSGTVVLNGANTATKVDVNGGTLAGSGSIDPTLVTIHSGATFSPGTPGVAGTSMTIVGNLAFQSGALYLVYLSANANASSANVSSNASLAGTVQASFSSGSTVSKRYTILTASGGIGGTAFSSLTNINLPSGATDSLSYDANHVYLNVAAPFSPLTGLNINQQNVANALSNFFNTNGSIPAAFFGLTPNGLTPNGLTQIDGENGTGAERAAFQLTDEFLTLMLDPFVNGRAYVGGGGGPTLGFAPDAQASLPPDVALAYASILNKAPPTANFDQRWSAWGSAYGGSGSASGNAVVGSNNIAASTFGFAGGMDYHISPHTVVGFALGGAGTSWGLANALGTGRSDAFQAGTYGITWFGPAYFAGALAFTNHWFTTGRSALGDALTANFLGQSYGVRAEGGYRFGVLPTLGVTPYGAVQFQDFHTPAYSESDPFGGGFGLSYNAMNATDVRTELGSRFDAPTLLYGKPLVLYGRVAWAHDFVSNPALSAVFETLPGANFTVFGAAIPHDSALTSAGAQLFLSANWSLIAKFDGEIAAGSQTYAGSGTLRYTW